jgi:carbon storage regulator
MLVLHRKPGETIVVGDITFTVCEMKGGGVRIGIEAPDTLRIMRGELIGKTRLDEDEGIRGHDADTVK